ncbi:MATE family efflux transporter [Actinobacteria bacterium YIM 96077]|uniref:MATE family efflux transporter n=1 Tax=Phytoactinopolyspora halophila TaxID=1981511 RepID=A0A329QP51_9ACTN|nr:MATE family efflux transporter [Phytoactinopolyspora halophila]AYY15080.1 MATE family efflux transporter [Actinobacteria bacterium YIM 96077]RAW14157.1 MATE family efflux transporter [Phytoactinopolyspora halophila]
MFTRPAAFHRHPADREILRLALPALGALVAEPLFLLTDSAIIGHLGTPELAGLGIASTVLSTLVNVSIFLAYGTTAAVARMLGASDMRGALHSGLDGCWLAVVIGTGTLAAGWPLTPWIVERFGPAPDVAEQAETYLRISLLGIPAMLLVLAATGVLRGLQDTKTPLYVAVTGAGSNVVLNIGLVHGIGLGIAGSAIGTVISQVGMATVFVVVVARAARREGASLAPHWPGVRRAFGAGVPLIVRTVAMRIALIITTVVATGLGTAELAAHQVAFNTWILLALVLDAVAIAAQALVGRALGASDVEQARDVTRRMVQWGVLSGLALAIVVLGVATVYPVLFTQDPEVRSLLVTALVVAAVLQPAAGWVFVLDGVLIGAGDGPYLAWASVASVAIFLPAAAAVHYLNLSGTPGMVGLWSAIGVWTLARLVTLEARERRGKWAITGAVR